MITNDIIKSIFLNENIVCDLFNLLNFSPGLNANNSVLV